MCKQCELNPVYEFTNKRKVCGNCFINYFNKKVLYTIRKFKMADHSSVIFLKSSGSFRDVVLEDILKMFVQKSGAEFVKLSSKQFLHTLDLLRSKVAKNLIAQKSISSYFFADKKKLRNKKIQDGNSVILAISDSTDIIAERIIDSMFEGNLEKLKVKPLEGRVIRPFYLMLDREIFLYAELKHLTRSPKRGQTKEINEKKPKFDYFIKAMEEKHPELKHSVVSSYLGLFY